jgi:tetratricopeptide (TPR) repeat protein/MinD-like ATPase involved in chromosome partitioning or flagellar assembly
MSAGASLGAIVTFYSYKGGVGRTMALANIAVQLARKGNSVLMVDWDLEAPGLSNYFINQEARQNVKAKPAEDDSGLLGLLKEGYDQATGVVELQAWRRRIINLSIPPDAPTYSNRSPPTPGPLALLPAGYGGKNYSVVLADFSWKEFFAHRRGGEWLESLRREWSANYNFILVDSRTGLTDSGGVCTVQMPDFLVLVFTANDQSLTNGLKVIAAIQEERQSFAFERGPLAVVPLLSRWDSRAEVDLADAWIKRVSDQVGVLTSLWLPKDFSPRDFLEKTRVPHVARFSFGEPLPTLTHRLTDPDFPGLPYDSLARLLDARLSNAGSIIDPSYEGALSAQQAALNREFVQLRRKQKRAVLSLIGGGAAVAVGSIWAAVTYHKSAQGPSKEQIEEIQKPLAEQLAAQNALIKMLLEKNPSAEPGVQQALGQALQTIMQGAEAGDTRLQQALALLKENKIAEATQLLTAYQHEKEAQAGKDTAAAEKDRKEAAVAYRNLGAVAGLGDPKRALEAYEKALTLDPDDLDSLYWAGLIQIDYGDLDAAQARLERALTLAKTANRLDYQGRALVRLGTIKLLRGDLAAALQSYQEGLAIADRLAKSDPANAEWQRDLAVASNNVGDVRFAQGNLEAALKSHQDAVDIFDKLGKSDPVNAEWQRDLSQSFGKVGDVQSSMGLWADALKSYRDSLSIIERLTTSDPSNAGWQRNLSVAYDNVGGVQQAQGDLSAALKSYQYSLAIAERLAKSDPGNAGWQRDLSVALNSAGGVQQAQGDLSAALKSFQDSLAIAERLAKSDPGNAGWQRDLAVSLAKLADVYRQSGNKAKADHSLRQGQAIMEQLAKLSPDNEQWKSDLAQFDDQIAELDRDTAKVRPSLPRSKKRHE